MGIAEAFRELAVSEDMWSGLDPKIREALELCNPPGSRWNQTNDQSTIGFRHADRRQQVGIAQDDNSAIAATAAGITQQMRVEIDVGALLLGLEDPTLTLASPFSTG